MPTWNADQYLIFSDERSRPARELAARVQVESPKRIMDLGCGPGNSTQILVARWPNAQIQGIDTSANMIATAKQNLPNCKFDVADITTWAARAKAKFDVVFSNAAMQWVDDHIIIFPELLNRVARKGALAIQMPANFDAPAHELMRKLAASPRWRKRFPPGTIHEWHVHEPEFYYDVLAPVAQRIDLWLTDYFHVMASPESIVEWYRGTGLRPFLDPLESTDQELFLADYLNLIVRQYPPHPDGKVLFPFRRLFVIAYAK